MDHQARASRRVCDDLTEFNLLGWRVAIRDAPFLDGAATETWLRQRLRMENAPAANDWPVASDAACRMMSLDGGAMPQGLH
jgi:hypothetical protein